MRSILLSFGLLIASGCASPPQLREHAATAPAVAPRDSESSLAMSAPAATTLDSQASAAERDEEPKAIELEVSGCARALVVLPRSTTKRPVLIAAHGAGDGPEWQCETWSAIVRGRAFILCPRGVRLNANPNVPSGYFYRNHLELEREVMAAVAALGSAYPGRADTERIVYTGYSQGATMGALMLIQHAALFPRLILIEGGGHDWNRKIARTYRDKGGERVLFACGVRHCANLAQRAATQLNAEGVAARVEYAQGAGHIYGGDVGRRVADALDWVLEGDPRWSAD